MGVVAISTLQRVSLLLELKADDEDQCEVLKTGIYSIYVINIQCNLYSELIYRYRVEEIHQRNWTSKLARIFSDRGCHNHALKSFGRIDPQQLEVKW